MRVALYVEENIGHEYVEEEEQKISIEGATVRPVIGWRILPSFREERRRDCETGKKCQ